MAAGSPGTSIMLPLHLFERLRPAELEIGGLFLFDKPAPVAGQLPNLIKLNGVMIMGGDAHGVNFQRILNKFGDHEDWMMFHTHPPRGGRMYNGFSSSDLFLILYNNLTLQRLEPTVHHVLVTDIHFHISWVNPEIFNGHLRILNSYKSQFNDYNGILLLYKEFFNIIQDEFVNNFPTYGTDEKCLDRLNNISFLPHDERFIFTFAPRMAAKITSNPQLESTWNWFLSAGQQIQLVNQIFTGLFKTSSVDMSQLVSMLHSNVTPIINIQDDAYIFHHTTPWVATHDFDIDIIPIEAMQDGGKRKKQKKRKTRSRAL